MRLRSVIDSIGSIRRAALIQRLKRWSGELHGDRSLAIASADAGAPLAPPESQPSESPMRSGQPAARSRSWFDHATLTRIGVALGVALGLTMFSGSANADVSSSRQFVVTPSECAQYWLIPGGPESPAGWNQLLSFAACVQDATVARIEDEDELEQLVDELQSALDPALQLYIAAVEEGPGPIKIRATLQIAMAEAALITRARTSIPAPLDLRTNAVAAVRYR